MIDIFVGDKVDIELNVKKQKTLGYKNETNYQVAYSNLVYGVGFMIVPSRYDEAWSHSCLVKLFYFQFLLKNNFYSR